MDEGDIIAKRFSFYELEYPWHTINPILERGYEVISLVRTTYGEGQYEVVFKRKEKPMVPKRELSDDFWNTKGEVEEKK